MSLNPEWEIRLKDLCNKYMESERIALFNIINQLNCNEVYSPNFSEHDIFKHIYNKQNSHDCEMTPKRQPNPFMIFRTALGKTATQKGVKLGDGTSQSRTAGILWRGANQNEKKNFENLSLKFKALHKLKFPEYEYKPRQRNPISGTFVDMSNNNFVTIPNQSMPQQPHMHQQIQPILKDNNDIWDQFQYPAGLEPDFMSGLGGFSYQQPEIYVPQQQYEFYQTNPLNDVDMLSKVEYSQQLPPPSIAGNCPNQYDINTGSYFFDKPPADDCPNQYNNGSYSFDKPPPVADDCLNQYDINNGSYSFGNTTLPNYPNYPNYQGFFF